MIALIQAEWFNTAVMTTDLEHAWCKYVFINDPS